jgi:O-acetyl-ADP-ribose deacetylase (regulator of RNase III)
VHAVEQTVNEIGLVKISTGHCGCRFVKVAYVFVKSVPFILLAEYMEFRKVTALELFE